MQEVVIVLAIIVGAIWLLVKIFVAIGNFVDQTMKKSSEAAAKRTEERYKNERGKLRQYVRTLIPNELDSFEERFLEVHLKFQQVQETTIWVAKAPQWKEVKFEALDCPHKDSGCGDMRIEDLNAILRLDSDSSTWSYEESIILSGQCKYPSSPPVGDPKNLALFPTLEADLKTAVFDIDSSHIGRDQIDRYFADERGKVLAYNNRREELIAKAESLNSTIEEWNRKNRTSWEKYVAEFNHLKDGELLAFQRAAELYTKACCEEVNYFKCLLEGYKKGEKQSVIERLGFVLDMISLPDSVPHTWDIDFDEEQRIAVIDIGLPDVVHRPPYKTVILKSGAVRKSLNQTERKELIPKVHPAILLRTAYEVFRNDTDNIINLLVVNGWITFDDPATGINTKAYTASLMVTKDQIMPLKLTNIDPIIAFHNLHGKSAGKLVEIVPIEPLLSLNRNDSRFVNAKEILKGLGAETNLAAMDWQDFEHLIRELFEKEFSGRGAEVKITQASRDRGVDAIVFDPDPIHGGKYVIQAKRYTNTVDVSAVRDLCAVVNKEGASRGILVTTSTYGGDAYAFANNEPVTLLNGAELLGLLKKHGYTFRINLQEARRSD
jgi:restriction system protein